MTLQLRTPFLRSVVGPQLNANWPLVVPPLPPPTSDDPHVHRRDDKTATHRCHYWRWAALLKRSLGIDGDKRSLRRAHEAARSGHRRREHPEAAPSLGRARPTARARTRPRPAVLQDSPRAPQARRARGDLCRGRDVRCVTDRALVPPCAPWTARSAQIIRLAPFACAYSGPRDRDFPHGRHPRLARNRPAACFQCLPCPATPTVSVTGRASKNAPP